MAISKSRSRAQTKSKRLLQLKQGVRSRLRVLKHALNVQDPIDYLEKANAFFKSIVSHATKALHASQMKKYAKYTQLASMLSIEISDIFHSHGALLKNSTDELLDLFSGFGLQNGKAQGGQGQGPKVKIQNELDHLMDETRAYTEPLEYLEDVSEYLEEFIETYDVATDESSNLRNRMSIFASMLAQGIDSAIQNTTQKLKKSAEANVEMGISEDGVAVPKRHPSLPRARASSKAKNENENNGVEQENAEVDSLASLFNSSLRGAFAKK